MKEGMKFWSSYSSSSRDRIIDRIFYVSSFRISFLNMMISLTVYSLSLFLDGSFFLNISKFTLLPISARPSADSVPVGTDANPRLENTRWSKKWSSSPCWGKQPNPSDISQSDIEFSCRKDTQIWNTVSCCSCWVWVVGNTVDGLDDWHCTATTLIFQTEIWWPDDRSLGNSIWSGRLLSKSVSEWHHYLL